MFLEAMAKMARFGGVYAVIHEEGYPASVLVRRSGGREPEGSYLLLSDDEIVKDASGRLGRLAEAEPPREFIEGWPKTVTQVRMRVGISVWTYVRPPVLCRDLVLPSHLAIDCEY